MTQAPFHTRETFERVIAGMIAEADSKNRGDDLDRVVQHVLASPAEVSNLAAIAFMLDEEFRGPFQHEIEAYRRWLKKKELPSDDHAIFDVLIEIYRAKRGAT